MTTAPDLRMEPHPLLLCGAFITRFPAPLGRFESPGWLTDWLRAPTADSGSSGAGPAAGAPPPLQRDNAPDPLAVGDSSRPPPFHPDETVRTAVRDALRLHGYKPTGRGKPASEYLIRAAGEGALRSINAAVDACNVVSLHSGLPISVVDLDRARPPFRIAVAAAGERYVFNPAGQEIDLGGLPCLFDADGPCANAVKDSQRTKTHDATRRTLTVVWGVASQADRLRDALAWYRSLLESAGAETDDVAIS